MTKPCWFEYLDYRPVTVFAGGYIFADSYYVPALLVIFRGFSLLFRGARTVGRPGSDRGD